MFGQGAPSSRDDGIGLTTGDVYQGTGVSQEQFGGALREEYAHIDNLRLSGVGPDNNLLIHDTFHFTVNANGVVSAYVSNYSVESR